MTGNVRFKMEYHLIACIPLSYEFGIKSVLFIAIANDRKFARAYTDL